MKLVLFVLFCSVALFAKTETATSLEQLYDNLAKDIPQDGVERRILILPFSTQADSLKDEAKMTAEYGVSYFVGEPNITVVERENLAKAMQELELSASGMISEQSALEAGKMLSASYMITGSIAQKEQYQTISAKMIEVETGKIVGASFAKFRTAEANKFYKDALGEQLSPSSAVFRSAVAPGWGQFYTKHPVQGTLFSTLFVGAVGALGWSAVDYNAKSETVDANEEKVFLPLTNSATGVVEDSDQYKERVKKIKSDAIAEMNSASDRTNLIIVATAGMWAVNMIDAFVLGKLSKKKLTNSYFSVVPTTNNEFAYSMGMRIVF